MNNFVFVVIIISLCKVLGQNIRPNPSTVEQSSGDTRFSWCTVNPEEQQKCLHLSKAIERDHIHVGREYFKLDCKQASSKHECMVLLDEEKASITTLDAGEVFVGGRYHSLIPVSQEVNEAGLKHYYAVAVVKKDTLLDVNSLSGLRGKKGCFAGTGTMAGWVIPIYTLIHEGSMEIIDCNNHVKSATEFFGPSCAVNSLIDKYNPIGDNSDKLCRLCIGKVPGGKCTDADPYAGFEGAFRCLLEAGDIAFLKHTTVDEVISGIQFTGVSKDSFQLFCKDGTRRPINDYRNCNWGVIPANAVVTTSGTASEIRKKYQMLLQKLAELYGPNQNSNSYDNTRYNNDPSGNDFDSFRNSNPTRFKRQNRDTNSNTNNGLDYYQPNNNNNRDSYNRDPFSRDPYKIDRDHYGVNIDPYRTDLNYNRNDDNIFGDNHVNGSLETYPNYNRSNINVTYYEYFNLFESSPRYGIHGNLLVQDTTRTFAAVLENQQTFSGFLGDSLEIIMGVRKCPVNHMTLCVTSDPELQKCVDMKNALKTHLLKPEMRCEKAHSQINCMQKIQAGIADVAVFDASDVYTAGLNFDLIPFISEVYNLGEPEYYVVAVAKEADPSTELTYLRGKYTCHGGINSAAGWVYPLAYLISNGWIRSYGCNSIRAAAEYFTKSCVPGALSTEYNSGVPYDNLCDLCHGASFRYCRRDASEDYYGHTGAFRCLVEGGGHVAFVKHTTVMENTGGQRREWWARDALMDDFELLCPDGTRAEVQDYKKCNLGKVKSNAIVTRGGYRYNATEINAFINLFLYSQTFSGRKSVDDFSLFLSPPPFTDLIFQDATQQLKIIPPDERYYSTYLGKNYMRARRIVDCHAGTSNTQLSLIVIMLSCITSFTLSIRFRRLES